MKNKVNKLLPDILSSIENIYQYFRKTMHELPSFYPDISIKNPRRIVNLRNKIISEYNNIQEVWVRKITTSRLPLFLKKRETLP